jgi:transcriptional regulator with XRE-family HTH domain
MNVKTNLAKLTLGEALRRERTRRKERQVDTADHFGVTQPSYQRWEADKSRPSAVYLKAVAEYLELPVDVVWRLMHDHGDAEPTLDALDSRLAVVERDVAVLKRFWGTITDAAREQSP